MISFVFDIKKTLLKNNYGS